MTGGLLSGLLEQNMVIIVILTLCFCVNVVQGEKPCNLSQLDSHVKRVNAINRLEADLGEHDTNRTKLWQVAAQKEVFSRQCANDSGSPSEFVIYPRFTDWYWNEKEVMTEQLFCHDDSCHTLSSHVSGLYDDGDSIDAFLSTDYLGTNAVICSGFTLPTPEAYERLSEHFSTSKERLLEPLPLFIPSYIFNTLKEMDCNNVKMQLCERGST